MECVYAVIDIKSFYASCECAARGLDLFSTPLIVADPERTSSTIVMSATPYLKAKYGCPNVCRVRDLPDIPDLIMAKPRMRYYLEMSARVVSIFLDYVDESDLHVYSIDESFLRLDPYLSLYRCSPEELVSKIQRRIKEELGLVATAGIGPNMFLAKVCLDNEGKKRPPYQARWTEENAKEKLWAIRPITKIWGIAGGIASHLSRLGIENLEALSKTDPHLMKKEFGVIGEELLRLANGIDHANIEEKYVPKARALSYGQTLMKDYDLPGARLLLREMCDELCFRLRRNACKTRCVSLMVAYSKEAHSPSFSRQKALDIATDDNDSLYATLLVLFDEFAVNAPIRALSISFASLSPYVGQQYSLFECPEAQEERHRLLETWDEIRLRYGSDALLRGTSFKKDSTIRLRHTQIGGHHA